MPATASQARTPAPVRKPDEQRDEHDERDRDQVGDQRGQHVRPSTLDRAIGIDWNRSKMPPCRSWKSRYPV